MKQRLIVFCIAAATLFSCQKPCQHNENHAGDYLHQAVLWYQLSGEMQACSHQAFNLARTALEVNLAADTCSLPKAIILDIDETLLDNSPFMAEMSINHQEFSPELWEEWSKKEAATALPGAIGFIKYAIDKGVEVFYVSNRMTGELQWTINNMRKLKFPEIQAENYFLKSTTSDKKMRRDSISQHYSVILFVGDNLGDFSNDFDNRSSNFAKDAVDSLSDLFGTRYIIIPNPTYGSWEKPLYEKDGPPKHEQRRSLMIAYDDL
ncbi:MAG TPA: 5'-nucleotidase, lipoprotein e(P4) family [Bacteroidales bacterium]|nr:5'-nucleotidase, lipoprotein e(P4) family [Bacteroidales bacterium]